MSETLKKDAMSTTYRDVAETVLDKSRRRESEITTALQQERARHEAAVQNMYRLRTLRLLAERQTE